MTDQADETIIVRYVVEAQDAITKAKEFRAQVDSIKTQLKSMASASGQSFKDLAVGMQQVSKINFQKAIADIRQQGKLTDEHKANIRQLTLEYNNLQKAITQAYGEAKKESSGVAQATTQVGVSATNAASGFSTLKVAIGAAIGLFAIQAIKQFFGSFINYAKEAIQVGYEFTKGLYQLNVGVNALRRAGTDITFGDVTKQLQTLKSEFGIFATKDLVVGASAFLNLNRDMGFTKEQLFELQEAIATLAVVNGRSMDEVQKTVALALSSGYTEGLQRLGVSINRVTIAEEAARLGWDKGYTALTEQQRALATYNLVLSKTSVYSDDLLTYQETLPGAIDTATAALTDQSAIIGNSLLPYYVKLLETWVKIVKAFRVDIQFGVGLTGVQEKAIADREAILGRELTTWEKITEKFKAGADYAAAVINNAFYGIPMPSEMMIEEAPVIPKEIPSLTEDQVAAVESVNEKILDLQANYDNDRRDLAIDLQRDLAEIEQDGADKIADIMADHAQKMLDIANKASDQIRDAQLRYDLDVQQAWDEYYSNLASAAESHSNKLLKIEEDYQEKLKRLKEGFLMDLEDALHERDARQVLRLIRQYNLDRTQATRERDQNLREEARAYEEQLHELDRQRRDRLKKLREELDLRLQMIVTQRDRELALEIEKYNHKMAQQRMENIKEREERLLKYQEDLQDLQTHLNDRLMELAKGLAAEITLTQEGMQGVLDVLKSYLGPGGAATQVFDYYIAYATAAMAAVAQAVAAMAVVFSGNSITYPGGKPGKPLTTPNKAKGGMEYADKPTTALFGEAGPELALFMPLSGGIGSLSASTKTPVPEMKQGDKGKLMVEVLLGAGLEGRIIDRTLNNVANVVLRSIK